jgi:hypothetical protein
MWTSNGGNLGYLVFQRGVAKMQRAFSPRARSPERFSPQHISRRILTWVNLLCRPVIRARRRILA